MSADVVRLVRLDELIEQLQAVREGVGENAPVAFRGRDGRWTQPGWIGVVWPEKPGGPTWVGVQDGMQVTPPLDPEPVSKALGS